MRKLAVLTLAGLVLAGGPVACERKPALRPAAEPERPAPEAKAAAPAGATKTNSDWAFGRGQNSVEIVHLLNGDASKPNLRLVCAKGAGFLAVAPTLKPVASEERLSLGAGGKSEALVATAAAQGVQATGPITAELLAIVEGGGALGVNHGAQTLGPLDAPPEGMRRAFADICRGLYRAGEV